MESTHFEHRIRARDASLRMLHRLTLGAAFAAVGALGVFSAVSAATIPGSSSGSPATAQTTTSTSAGVEPSPTSNSSSSSSSSSSTLQPSSGVGAAGTGGHAVTGASH